MGKYEDECYKRYFDFLGEVDKRPKNIDVVMSKRQLNIAKEAEKRYLGRPEHQYYSAEDLAKAFRDGAEWADSNPAQDVVNLNDVCHSSTEIPTKEGLILYRTTLGRYDVIFQSGNKEGIWKVFVKDYGVAEWAYVNELRPKGGEQ